MHYRILVTVISILALIGLSGPAAFARSQSQDFPCDGMAIGGSLYANDNHGVFGLTFNGAGNQATITIHPANLLILCRYPASGLWTIENGNFNCLRMRDASNNYAVMEESGCNINDDNELWHIYTHNSLVQFQNFATNYYLGVSCPAENDNKVWGVTGDSGTCNNWIDE